MSYINFRAPSFVIYDKDGKILSIKTIIRGIPFQTVIDITKVDTKIRVAIGRGRLGRISSFFSIELFTSEAFLKINGSNSMAGNLNLNNNKIINVADGTDNGGAINHKQLMTLTNNVYTKSYSDDNFYQPVFFFNRLTHNNAKTVIFPFSSYPPVYFPNSDLSDIYHNIGGDDNTLIEVKKDGLYEIHFNDFYKNSGSGNKRVILRRIKRHDGNKEEKITMSYLDGSSSWMRLAVFHVVRLRERDNIGIITEGVELDGEEFSQFSIKK